MLSKEIWNKKKMDITQHIILQSNTLNNIDEAGQQKQDKEEDKIE